MVARQRDDPILLTAIAAGACRSAGSINAFFWRSWFALDLQQADVCVSKPSCITMCSKN